MHDRKNNMVATVLIIAGILLLGWMIVAIIDKQRDDARDSVPVMAEFEDKVVYTVDQDIDVAPLLEDCRKRGGEFNRCGTPCSSNAEVCAQACAYTCELGARR